MRKNLSAFLLILCLIVCLFAVTACDDGQSQSDDEHKCVFDQRVATSEYLASPANCTDSAKYYLSCTCGKKGTETFDDGVALGHTYATTWSYDNDEHWHAATCQHSDLKQDVAAHNLVVANDGLSKSCACGFTQSCIVDVDVLLEAEDAVLNANHVSVDKRAHGGKYALAFNDCGQGMYYRYYAYEAGTRSVDVAYATGSASAYMTMFVNGGEGVKVEFTEQTGWFGDNGGVTATATVNITVAKGWNEIYLIKNGTKDDNYGGYAQIDYIKIKGTQNDYTGQTFDRTIESYKLECETAEWHWTKASTRPSAWNAFSMGYGLGNMDADGDGVKFTFTAQSTGTYKVRLAYGCANNQNVNVEVWINEVLVNEGNALSNGSTGWDNVQLDNSGITVELVEGYTYTIDFRRSGQWLTPDYLLLELVK